MEGIVLKKHGGFYQVFSENEEYLCKLSGKQKYNQKQHIVVGDYVIFEQAEDYANGIIIAVKKRKNFIHRPELANINQLLIISSIKYPNYDSFLLDKLIALARFYKIEPSICVSKIDLANAQEKEVFLDIYKNTGINIFFSGIGEDLSDLKKYLNNQITALAGNSGVGKSSLINRIFNKEIQEIQEISFKLNRGKNTTRTSEFFPFNNGYIIDTPGFSALDLNNLVDKNMLKYLYPEFEYHADLCKYSNCIHLHEPGCYIKDKISEGYFSQERYENYKKIYEELLS